VENCYISVGDNAVAIKSGWDVYGTQYARPCVNITIRNLFARSLIRYFPASQLPLDESSTPGFQTDDGGILLQVLSKLSLINTLFLGDYPYTNCLNPILVHEQWRGINRE
jgi:hypothetical protein